MEGTTKEPGSPLVVSVETPRDAAMSMSMPLHFGLVARTREHDEAVAALDQASLR